MAGKIATAADMLGNGIWQRLQQRSVLAGNVITVDTDELLELCSEGLPHMRGHEIAEVGLLGYFGIRL